MACSDFQGLLSVRLTESGQTVKWTQIMKVMVSQKTPMTIFFKNSHLQDEYDSIAFKRFKGNMTICILNKESQKISTDDSSSRTSSVF